MRYFALFILIVCLVACAMEAERSCTNLNDRNDLSYVNSSLFQVYIEDGFSEEKKMALAGALASWSIKTESRVTFEITFIPLKAMKNNPHMYHTIFIFNRAPENPEFTGLCVWQEGAVIEIVPRAEGEIFSAIAMHEIGHALHLPHYEGKNQSIMHPSTSLGHEIACQDILDFCNLWDCHISCQPIKY